MLYLIWISRISEYIKINTIKKLLKNNQTLKNIYELNEKQLIQNGISNKDIKIILCKELRENLNEYKTYLEKNKIKLISCLDEEYPEKLKRIYDMPIVLFLKGNENLLKQKSIAIIGTRNCTEYGKRISFEFANKISKQNINIISGLAKGIDLYAHKGAYKNIGRTIAIMASGFDMVYPKENINMYNQILVNDGLIITEQLPFTKLEPKHFIKRNRIISALSDGILIVEAQEKSGVFSTVDFALEHNKEVFVVPGNIDSKASVGSNRLLKQGAILITEVDEIIENIRKVEKLQRM